MPRKKRKDPLYGFVESALQASDRCLVWLDENALPESMGDKRKTIEAVQYAFWRAVHAIADVYWVQTDMVGCLRMARKHPWDPDYISKGDHLRYVWILYIQFVYVFEERMKSAVQWCDVLPRIDDVKIDNKKYFREIKKSLGATIKHRGQYVHQGRPPADQLTYFGAVDFMQTIGRPLAEGFSVQAHGLRATRKYICSQIESELEKMESISGAFFSEHVPVLISRMGKFYAFVSSLVEGEKPDLRA